MEKELICFWLGRAAFAEGAALLLPALYAYLDGGSFCRPFIAASLAAFWLGGFLFNYGKNHRRRVSVMESATIMVLLWPWLAGIGMIPFWMLGQMSPMDAFLEGMSDVVTAGLPILPGNAPEVLFLWQGILMWLGGLHFLIVLVTVLPQVSGCFGIELSLRHGKAFSPMIGRMESMAHHASVTYSVLTLLSAGLFLYAGLMPWEALENAMRCISTGGGTHFIGRGRNAVEAAAMVSMFLAAGNLLLYWRMGTRRSLGELLKDSEIKMFLQLVVASGLMVSGHLVYQGYVDSEWGLHEGFFHMLSFLSTTGFQVTPLSTWPDFDLFLLLLLPLMGGCMGSVTGGMKMIRLLVLFKLAAAEIRRTLHPRMVTSIQVSGIFVPSKIIGRILSFFALYMATFFGCSVLLTLSGSPFSACVGMTLSCLTGVGSAPGLCTPEDFLMLPMFLKPVCALILLLGRVEIFAVLFLLQAGRLLRARRW